MSFYQNQLSEFSNDYYAGAATGILVSSCVGAIAAMFVLGNGHGLLNMIQLGLIVVSCMWFNTTVLAQLSSKFVFNSLIFSVIVNVVLICMNIF